MCCLQDLRWRVLCARMLGLKRKTFNLWWSGKGDGVGGLGVMVKEELFEKVVEIRRASGRNKKGKW